MCLVFSLLNSQTSFVVIDWKLTAFVERWERTMHSWARIFRKKTKIPWTVLNDIPGRKCLKHSTILMRSGDLLDFSPLLLSETNKWKLKEGKKNWNSGGEGREKMEWTKTEREVDKHPPPQATLPRQGLSGILSLAHQLWNLNPESASRLFFKAYNFTSTVLNLVIICEVHVCLSLRFLRILR